MKFAAASLIALALVASAPRAQAHGASGQQDSLGADWREQQDEARKAVRAGQHVPLSQVVDAVRRRMPGRLLDTGLEKDGSGRAVYRVRWAAADGRRVDVLVDAQTGRILSEQGR